MSNEIKFLKKAVKERVNNDIKEYVLGKKDYAELLEECGATPDQVASVFKAKEKVKAEAVGFLKDRIIDSKKPNPVKMILGSGSSESIKIKITPEAIVPNMVRTDDGKFVKEGEKKVVKVATHVKVNVSKELTEAIAKTKDAIAKKFK